MPELVTEVPWDRLGTVACLGIGLIAFARGWVVTWALYVRALETAETYRRDRDAQMALARQAVAVAEAVLKARS